MKNKDVSFGTLALAMVFCLILLALTGCSEVVQVTESAKLPARFVVIDDAELEYASRVVTNSYNYDLDSAMMYVVDVQTRVVYIYVNQTSSRYSGMALSPLYNADGTLVTYQGEIPNY